MRLASTKCREQEAIQLEIAKNDPLENRRKIAADAAKAWGIEAQQAENYEAGQLSHSEKEDDQIRREFAEETDEEARASFDDLNDKNDLY